MPLIEMDTKAGLAACIFTEYAKNGIHVLLKFI
jgi:hypothetical protein